MSWSKDYKKSIDCDNPKGFSQKAHCAARRKRARGEETKSKSPFNEMHEVKSHKSVEQIAKKHRLEVSFIKNQLEMGIPIEHEHTKDKDLATDIALQHLDEIPDYYTRLKKMEADAKKHHKKFKDVKEETKSGDQGLHDWFNKSKSSDGTKGWVQLGGKWSGEPCARQPGQTSTPKCGSSKMKRALSKDEEEAARRRKNRLDPNQPEKTGGAKPTNVRTEEMDLQEVKDKPGKGSGKKDACYHKVKSRYDVWPSAYASGALVKCRKVGADNWGTKSEEVKMIRYCPKCKKDETRDECKYGTKYWDMFSIPSKLNKEYHPNSPHPGNFPESYDHEYSMARSELETIISAAKRMKKKIGKGEGNLEAWVQSKITKAADYIDTAADYVDSGQGKVDEACWDGYEQEGMKKKGNKVVPNCVKKEGYSNWKEELKLVEGWPFGPNTVTPQNSPTGTKSVEQDKKYPARQNSQPVNVQYGSKGEKKITPMPAGQAGLMQYKYGSTWGMPQYQSYEPEGELVEYSNWREEIGLSEDWQKVNRQDKTDGLSQKAVDAYRREHPGSKLQTAVTEKKPKGKRAKRRSSFCRRMKGMKSKLTSAKTARDPDSRINKALRRWNCN
jgi:Domain of unknown function (DUF6321)/Protein of unknown function (DUF5661)